MPRLDTSQSPNTGRKAVFENLTVDWGHALKDMTEHFGRGGFGAAARYADKSRPASASSELSQPECGFANLGLSHISLKKLEPCLRHTQQKLSNIQSLSLRIVSHD